MANLDRFSQPLAGENETPKQSEVVANCWYCDEDLHEGQKVMKHGKALFCDTTCLHDYLMIDEVEL